MKLKDCTMGKIVCEIDYDRYNNNYLKTKKVKKPKFPYDCTNKEYLIYTLVGHIVGFSLNSLGETTVKVKWNDGDENEYYPKELMECEEQ